MFFCIAARLQFEIKANLEPLKTQICTFALTHINNEVQANKSTKNIPRKKKEKSVHVRFRA